MFFGEIFSGYCNFKLDSVDNVYQSNRLAAAFYFTMLSLVWSAEKVLSSMLLAGQEQFFSFVFYFVDF